MTSVPAELGQLTALTELYLHNNRLTSVPAELGQLAALTTLSLYSNRLTSVPTELGQLAALTELSLHNNQLRDPYSELAQRGTSAVLAYLRSLSEIEQVITLREARLILVGNGKVGKTQLKNALLGLPFVAGAPTTHGVEIDRQQRLSLPCKSGKNLALTIWDFGGQETYEVTHQFFYGKRSIYLLVWHPRATTPDLGVEAWLRKLKLRLGDHARVIIVATHKKTDQRPADLDLIGLKQKFGDIVLGFYQVENKWQDHADNGIKELKADIAAAANDLSVIGMKVNKGWLAVRDEVTALSGRETHIPRSRFDEIANRRGLLPEFAAVWLDLLHDFGDLLYYGDVEGLKNTVVLRPDWLTGAIAQVLDDAEVLKNRGMLDHARLPQLWAKYDPALHPFLHAVMEQFDICCREHEGQKWSLVGEKVPHERPDGIPEPNGRQLRMVYEFDEEPPGLMPWLIVRNYRFTTHKHWRLGAYLQHEDHGALVEFDNKNRRLSLNVHGAVPLNFFALLQDGVDQVLPRWKGLEGKVRQLIPCGQTRRDGSPCDRYFCLPDLKDAAANDEPLQCNGCRKMADVSRLLAGIGVREEPLVNQISVLLDEKFQAQTELIRQLFAHNLRLQLRAFSNVSKDAPRLFSMWPKATEDKSWWERLDPRKLGTRAYEVWLWCEHCEQPHPVKRYEVSIPAEWLVKIAPYAKMIATAIKVGLPAIGGGLGIYLDRLGASKEDKKDIADRIDKMSKLAEKCLSGDLETGHKREELTDGLSAPDGAALREFHKLLRDIDKDSHWGDLRPTATKEGDYLWMCPEHHKEFNPGLITIPTAASN
ncbi:MAG: leucine-rich repeat domain-containing protein [Planctomycetes bacterium]|nr:leucine-rich repeat domain-containing protein [Planctomycetota bacterium]